MTLASPDFPLIQQRLKAIGMYPGAIDDEWGPGMLSGVSSAIALVERAKGVVPPLPAAWPKLPAAYTWLREQVPVPRHLDHALKLLGTVEGAGAANSPTIMAWAAEAGLASTYSADSVPWCGLFMAVVMVRAGRPMPASPLWALNWGKFGVDGGQPELGDVLTFKREGGGHVAIYIGEDAEAYHVLGGNQGDKVSLMRIAKARMASCRQPDYHSKPPCVRPFVVGANGVISRNEA